MTKKYHTLVLIGRFQPAHNAHAAIIRRATTLAKQVIIIVGSAKQPRTYKNPWTSHERRLMLQNVCDDIYNDNLLKDNECAIRIEENIDTIYNDQAWAARIQTIVAKYTASDNKIGIIGHKKDDQTSSYLQMFPQWGYENVELIEPLHATNIRDLYFRNNANMNFIAGVMPSVIYRLLDGWRDTPDYMQIIHEREFVDNYKKQYSSLPYAPVFVTVDAVVICSGHILMIKRRAEPGKGLWAFPGGFLNANTDRSIRDAMIRELREETGIKVPSPVLIGSIQKTQVFDAVDRSARGRTITHVFRIDLPNGELPKVRGLDDATRAQFIPIGELDSSLCFEDHFEIISIMMA